MWLNGLSSIMGDLEVDVSCLLPMIEKSQADIVIELREFVDSGVKAERLLERIKIIK